MDMDRFHSLLRLLVFIFTFAGTAVFTAWAVFHFVQYLDGVLFLLFNRGLI